MIYTTSAQMGAGDIGRPFITSPSSNKGSLPQSIARKLRSSWSVVPVPTSDHKNRICIICISDTHNAKPSLPDGDILLHAGDLSQYGTFDEIQAQLDWLNAQPHKHKIIIAGNHDLTLDEAFVKAHPDRELDKPGKSRGDFRWGDITYLHNSSVEVKCAGRTLKIYGSPMTPKCGNFSFQYEVGQDVWKDTLVVFGHIHNGRGEEIVTFNRLQACFEHIVLGVQPWINLFKLILYSILEVLGQTASAENHISSTHLVNAAMITGRGNQDRKEAIIIYF
ncbi:putative rhamnogalacturonate lyase C [Lachnellula suecica]|uniref:Putative rhamnogalacturonate lyase C n=1 Tax=Lachnellula suecica TaxID=602035 RepID=A0A8T9C814_9HELO|nr:putative rhamnogalacturonate lyase C [Lachnellula suecica]